MTRRATSGDDEPPARVASVSIKLPPFWPSDPQIWFAQVEAQFVTRGVTVQRTMFDYVVASLSPEYATEICDLILRPPAENPYDNVKQQLIKRTAASEQRRLQQLFSTEELGDRKPTQLLRRLQQLAGDTPGLADGKFIRELFLQRLPPHVRMVLASTRDDTTIEDLAQLADKIIEVATPSVATVSNSNPPLAAEIDSLRKELGSLKHQLKKLTIRSRSRTRSPSPAAPPHQRSSDASPPVCWYHLKYGDSARKCRQPCSMSGNEQASH